MHKKVDLFSLLNINVSEFQSVDNVTRGNPRAEELAYPYVFTICLFITGIVATLANLVLIFTFFVKRRLKHLHNVYITNLTINDLILGIVTFVAAALNLAPDKKALPITICHVTSSLDHYSVTCSVFTLALCALDRYIFVVNPRRYREGQLSLQRSLWILSGTWITSFVMSMVPQFGWGLPGLSFVTSRCPFYKIGETVYPLIDILITLPLPLVPIITLYAKTYIVALRTETDKDIVNDRLNRTKSCYMFTLVTLIYLWSTAGAYAYSIRAWFTGDLPHTLHFAIVKLLFRFGAAMRPVIFISLDWECRFTIMSMIPRISQIRRNSTGSSSDISTPTSLNRIRRPSFCNNSVTATAGSTDSYYSRHLSIDTRPIRKMSLVEGGRILAEGSAATLVRFDPKMTQGVKFGRQWARCG